MILTSLLFSCTCWPLFPDGWLPEVGKKGFKCPERVKQFVADFKGACEAAAMLESAGGYSVGEFIGKNVGNVPLGAPSAAGPNGFETQETRKQTQRPALTSPAALLCFVFVLNLQFRPEAEHFGWVEF